MPKKGDRADSTGHNLSHIGEHTRGPKAVHNLIGTGGGGGGRLRGSLDANYPPPP